MSLVVRLLFCATLVCGVLAKQPGSRTDDRFFCFTIRPTLNMKYTKAALTEGQWIVSHTDATETSSPVGRPIEANKDTVVCSSGRRGDESGTVGTVEFEDEAKNPITVTWSNTLNGRLTYSIKPADPTKYAIEEVKLANQRYKFLVTKL